MCHNHYKENFNGWYSQPVRWYRISGRVVQLNRAVCHERPLFTLENGDIGIFYLNGDAYIKKYQKNKDNVQLISLNKKYAPIQIKPGMELRTFGKVVK